MHARYSNGMAQDDILPEGFDWKAITPDDSPKTPPDLFADAKVQDLTRAKLAPADLAHDFSLPVYDFREGVRRETGETFHLHGAARKRPVALVFGSYT